MLSFSFENLYNLQLRTGPCFKNPHQCCMAAELVLWPGQKLCCNLEDQICVGLWMLPVFELGEI